MKFYKKHYSGKGHLSKNCRYLGDEPKEYQIPAENENICRYCIARYGDGDMQDIRAENGPCSMCGKDTNQAICSDCLQKVNKSMDDTSYLIIHTRDDCRKAVEKVDARHEYENLTASIYNDYRDKSDPSAKTVSRKLGGFENIRENIL